MSAPLTVTGLTKRFGGVVAVDHVDLRVEPGSLTGVIGPNGAGKTTLFDCIAGAQQPDEGSVRLGERSLDGMLPEHRTAAGLGRTFQQLQVFDGMTVRDNLVVAAESTTTVSWRDLLRPRHRPSDAVQATIDEVLERTGTTAVADRLAGELPVGTLRLVELARALCTRPRVLLLDEPASGLDTHDRPALHDLLLALPDDDLAVLLVEHDLDLVLAVCDRIHLMDRGRIVSSGTPDQMRTDPTLERAYLGGAA